MKITDDVKRAWQWASDEVLLSVIDSLQVSTLADALVDALAEVRRLEFEREHRMWSVFPSHFQNAASWSCEFSPSCDDPHHNYTHERWRAEVMKELSE